jgi:hypothetical protein
LVAQEELWSEVGCRCAQRVMQHRSDIVICCEGSAAGRGLCPTAATLCILKATSDHEVLSSDGPNTAAWLRSLFTAGQADAADLEVGDVTDWARRRYKLDALRDAAFVSDTFAYPVNRAAAAAEKWALYILSLYGLPRRLGTPRLSGVPVVK